jgi:uncharacterized protein YcbK (DUF882 family)
VQVGNPRPENCRIFAVRAGMSCGVAMLLLLSGSRVLQNAIAEGDTRTISLHHMHTSEDITITFKREGRYDESALEKLNWFLRDWRKQQETKMDPHLIDLVWEVQRESGSKEPIWVVCGYRSPETNAMLRRRSSGVARFSQHMLGHAMDFYIPGVPLDQLRAMGLRLQRGGVGFYPTSGSPFVHMDTGGVRMWPRMTREQLVRVFPDQRTVYLPSNGGPLAGYDLALADIKKRGGNSSDTGADVADAGESRHSNPIAKLFHLARGEEEEEADGTAGTPQPTTTESLKAKTKAAVATTVSRAKDKLAAEKAKLAQTAALAEEKLSAEKAKLAQVAARAEEKLAAEKAKLAQVAARAEEKLAAGRDKLAKVAAKANVFSRTEAAATATSPSQVILSRGFWQGLPDGMTASHPSQGATSAIAAVAQPSRVDVASADDTGSIGPFVAGQVDRVAPETALAYAAEQHDASAEASPETAALRAALLRSAGVQTGDNETTVVVKRVTGLPTSRILTVATKKVATVLADATRLSDPWLRAIVVSPSVERFLCITMLGVRDFRSLADLMVKPASSVMMSFAADPNPGLTHDHFSGSAVVFTPTVNYPLRTALLQ